MSRRDGQSEVYVMNADGSGKRNLTRNRASDDYPTWSPDGRRLAFLRGRDFYSYQLYLVNADGSGLRRLTLRVPEGTPETTGPRRGGQLVWSPDGRTIYFGRYLVSDRRERSAEAPIHPVDRRLVARRAADRLRAHTGLVPDGASSVLFVALGYLRHERRRERNPQADAQRTL